MEPEWSKEFNGEAAWHEMSERKAEKFLNMMLY